MLSIHAHDLKCWYNTSHKKPNSLSNNGSQVLVHFLVQGQIFPHMTSVFVSRGIKHGLSNLVKLLHSVHLREITTA